MKKTLLSLILLTSVMGTAQTVLLDEGFESYTNFAITNIGSWLTLDLDGRNTYTGGGPVVGGSTVPTWTANWTNAGGAMAFQIFNLSASNATNNLTSVPGVDEEIRNFTPHGGQKTAVSWAAVPAAGVNANNDWLISPAVTLGAGGNQLSLWVKALSPAFTENYKIGVYVGNGTPTSAANFTIISGATPLTAPYAAWQQVTQSLDAYSGQTIRIGIQYMSSDQYMFMLDDVKITTGTLSTSENSAKVRTGIYPNPTKGEVEIRTDKKIKSISVFDVSGKSVLKTASVKADLSSLPKGNYLMQIEFNDGTSSSEKVIKE
ncbi:T9SS-dependent choice-of-anchor J family protein [Chryseobacterium sp. PTM-20240506]|uniref:T9SS-dependent choice-of-anchor J family protein n=1 Tax=unclassified Chryseobacterium TaxID=2593645 RepID=UPI0023595CB2|nr:MULTISPECIES: choice-of-anchor J domain-containing protein [unclassified Chryseobacterium]MDC8106156.1 T9SS type A sorting domain-containing protein [Chryseobacterium sp. B21-037]MDQ1804662.1 choice-of-anchor J domain-containing protein [Chryseobacterium sp. CKR4-1]